jgi:TP901 family phage tail tape measure protein
VGAVRVVSVALKLQVQEFMANGGKAVGTLKAIGGEVDTLAKTHKDKMADLTKFSLGVGVGLLGIAAAAEKAAIAFDKQMSEVSAVSDRTGLSTQQFAAKMGQLRDAAIEAGKATVFSATDAAKAEAELAKAGVSTADILGGGLKGALSLAAAGSLDLEAAATDTAQALNIFGLRGSAAGHVADVLAAGANTSATDVGQLAYSLNQAGLVAHGATMSLEDTVGVLADFAQHGLVGSDAGTSLKAMLQALQAPSGKTADLMKSLGISAYDVSGKFIGITAVAQNLKDKLSGLTQAQRDAALAQIFGSDAVRAATILYQDGATGVQKWITGVNDSGAAARTAQAKMNNLSGDVEALKGSFETLAIESSGGVTAGLRTLTQGATGAVNALIDMPPVLGETLTILSGVGGAGLLGATGFVKVRTAGKDLITTLKDMGPAGEKAATAIGKIGSVGGKLGLIGIAAFGAYEGIHALLGYINSQSAPTHANIGKLTDDLQKFAETGQISGELAKVAGGNLDAFASKLSSAISKYAALQDVQANVARISAKNPGLSASEIGAQYQASVQSATENLNQLLAGINDVDASLAGLVKNGDAADAYKVFNELSQAMVNAGLPMDKINAEFPEYTKAAAGAAQANSIAAKSTNTLTTAQGELVLGLDDSITKGLALKDVIDSLSGANESAEKSTIAAQQSLADLSKKLEENRKAHEANRTSLVDSTQAGRDNLNMILNSIDTDKQQFQSLYAKKLQTEDQTSALKDATAQYDIYIGRLRTTLLNEGFNATQVDALIKAYAAIPPVKTTQVNTPGLTTAIDRGGALYRLLHIIPPVTSPKVTIPGLAGNYTSLGKLNRLLDNMNGKHVSTTVTTIYNSRAGQSRGAQQRLGGAYEHNAAGGIYQHAADGLLSQASTYSPVNPGRYMIAEPETGGEAFVPKRGNYGRSMSILGQAASWYGARVVAGGQGGGGGAVGVHLTADPVAAQAMQAMQIRAMVTDLGGGVVQAAFGSR